MSALLQLAERCEKATAEQQREMLDAAFVAIHGQRPRRTQGGSPEMDAWLATRNPFFALLEAGGFLDAAMQLVPEGYWHGYQTSPGGFRAHCFEQTIGSAFYASTSATPALALAAAALRARAAS